MHKEEEETEEEREKAKYRMKHKCADEAKVQTVRLLEIKKRIKKAKEDNDRTKSLGAWRGNPEGQLIPP